MDAEERRSHILEQLNSTGKVAINELSDLLAVTSATIRNDIRLLERKGLLVKTYGGAMTVGDPTTEINSDARQYVNEHAKQTIARQAAKLIKNNQTILLDTGTTTYHISKHLSKFENLTVITNDFDIATLLEMSPNVQVFLLGGFVKTGYHCTYHSYYSAALKQFNIDIAFMGANAINLEGAYAVDINLSATKQLMIQQSNRVVLCVDSNKFNRKALAKFAKVNDIITVISESLPVNIDAYLTSGIDFILAE